VPDKIESLAVLGEAFGVKVAKPTLKIYLKALETYSDAAVEKAVEMCILHEERFPAFATIKKYLDADKKADLADNATLQARYVRHEMQITDTPAWTDPITARIMTVHMPYAEWRARSIEDLDQYFTPMFTKKYREIAENPAELKRGAKIVDDQKKQLKPTTPANPEVVSRNKALLIRLLEHNKCDMALYPSGDYTDKIANYDKAAGVWPFKFGTPIMFRDEAFSAKLREASHDPRFKTYTAKTWDHDFGTKDASRIDTKEQVA